MLATEIIIITANIITKSKSVLHRIYTKKGPKLQLT